MFGFHIDFPEITPPITATGEHYYDAASGQPLPADSGDSAPSAAQRVRSVLESQFLSMRLHAGKSGLTEVRRLVVTGGASENPAILQVRYPLLRGVVCSPLSSVVVAAPSS